MAFLKKQALGGAGMGGTDTSMDQPGSTTLPGGDEEAEVAPPGREKQVKALKKKPGINPFAVAWASYNKSKGKKQVESVIVEHAMSPDLFKAHMRRYAEAWDEQKHPRQHGKFSAAASAAQKHGYAEWGKSHPNVGGSQTVFTKGPHALYIDDKTGGWTHEQDPNDQRRVGPAHQRVIGKGEAHELDAHLGKMHTTEAGLENFGDKRAEPFKANEDAAGTDHQFPTPVDAWRTSEDEAHIGFKALSGKLARKGDVRDPDAVAAAIGRKKYGAKGMAAKSRAGRTGEVPPGILSGDPILHDSEGEDFEGRFVVQSEAIEAIGGSLMGPLQRKGVKAAPPAQPDLITKSGDTQDIPLGAFKDDLKRKQSLRKMMGGGKKDGKKQTESEAVKRFNEAYA